MGGEYNGWRNVETWRVQLHLANDEHEREMVSDVALCYFKRVVAAPGLDNMPETFAGWLRGYVTERTQPIADPAHDTWAMFTADTVAGALARVDWDSIANHWLAAARDEMRTHGVQP